MTNIVSGISSLYLFVNLILVAVPSFPSPVTSSFSDSPLSTSIIHCRLKTNWRSQGWGGAVLAVAPPLGLDSEKIVGSVVDRATAELDC